MCAKLSEIFVILCCVSFHYSLSPARWDTKKNNNLAENSAEEVKRVTINGKEVVFRVIRGQEASKGEFPYIVSFRKQAGKSQFFANFCGATIISPNELLSAAHCFRKSNKLTDSCCRHSGRADSSRIKGVYAVAGSLHAVSHYHGDKDSDENGQWRTIRVVVFPTDYNFPKNDIAVVFLNSPFSFTSLVQPLPYATHKMEYSGSCTLSGYGRMEGNIRSKVLRKATIRILDSKTCNRIHSKSMAKFICTSDEVSDSSQGDSGGPLVCKNTGDPSEAGSSRGILVGVVSGGKKTTKDGSFYTRVTSFATFIAQKRANNFAARATLSKNVAILCSILSCSFR